MERQSGAMGTHLRRGRAEQGRYSRKLMATQCIGFSPRWGGASSKPLEAFRASAPEPLLDDPRLGRLGIALQREPRILAKMNLRHALYSAVSKAHRGIAAGSGRFGEAQKRLLTRLKGIDDLWREQTYWMIAIYLGAINGGLRKISPRSGDPEEGILWRKGEVLRRSARLLRSEQAPFEKEGGELIAVTIGE